jgi:diadenosine tetraphosphate (Ap4A) HIT family hydrolase
LKKALNPDGINIEINLETAAGASIPYNQLGMENRR